MKTLYIHVGTPKTGTTAIQLYCNNNRASLHEVGISYTYMGFSFPGIGRSRNGHFLVNRQYDENGKRNKAAEKEIIAQGWEKIARAFTKYDTVVLSDENLWNNKETDEKWWKKVKAQADAIDAQVKIIVYLRRQDKVIRSYWAQDVKESSTLNFEEFLSGGKAKVFRVDYATRLGELANVFGKDNIIVRTYEKEQFYKNSLTADFMNVLGVSDTSSFGALEGMPNESLDGIYLELKRELNNEEVFNEKKSFMVPLLVDIQQMDAENKAPNTLERGTLWDSSEYMANLAAENEQVAREYLGREDGILFYEIKDGKSGVYCTERPLTESEKYAIMKKALLIKNAEYDALYEKFQLEKEEHRKLQASVRYYVKRPVRYYLGCIKRAILKKDAPAEENLDADTDKTEDDNNQD